MVLRSSFDACGVHLELFHFNYVLSASIDLYAMLVGWKFCKRWNMACFHCCDKQCFRTSRIYSKGIIQGNSNNNWTGAFFFHEVYAYCWFSCIFFNIITLPDTFHQESFVRVAVWCIGEYGEMLVNNIEMLDIEDPITVSCYLLENLHELSTIAWCC